jgi:hypothetical protein
MATGGGDPALVVNRDYMDNGHAEHIKNSYTYQVEILIDTNRYLW